MTQTHLDSNQKLLRACSFAADKHRDQRRKDAGATPYINHPLEVAGLLADHGVTDVEVLMAAVLHDTIEDTDATAEEVEAHFGPRVRRIVEEVTDDKSLNWKARKETQIVNAKNASSQAKLVKIADKICNLRDLKQRPPKGWDRARCDRYFEWAHKVVAGVRGENTALDALFDTVYNDWFQSAVSP